MTDPYAWHDVGELIDPKPAVTPERIAEWMEATKGVRWDELLRSPEDVAAMRAGARRVASLPYEGLGDHVHVVVHGRCLHCGRHINPDGLSDDDISAAIRADNWFLEDASRVVASDLYYGAPIPWHRRLWRWMTGR